MIWSVLKQAGSDIWDELFYLILFNVITLLGTILIIPWPLVIFGLYEMAYDIGQGKGIKFTSFFNRAVRVWKPAYIWGGINLGAIIVLAINVNFYANITATWAGAAQIIMVGLLIVWVVLQLLMLPIYPRLEEPDFRLALRNAAILIARYPFPVLIMLGIVAALIGLMVIIPLFALLGVFSVIAVLSNRMMAEMVKRELGQDVGNTSAQEDPGFNIDGDEK